MTPLKTLLLVCTCLPLLASDFRTGQAARAVIGQPSFSAHEAGIVARALAVSEGTLYVADTSDRLLSFDAAHISSPNFGGCAVCVTAPASIAHQSVMPGVASSLAFGSTVVVADANSHRVMIWRGATTKPDVTLGLGEPVSVAFDGHRLFVGDAALHSVLVWKSLPTSNDQPADAVLGKPEFGNGSFAADTIDTPVALASDGANLFVADAGARRVLVYSPGDTPLSGRQVLNAASLTPGPLAPGTLVSIEYGGTAQRPHVLLDGIELPVLETTSDGIQTQLPYDLNTSASSLIVRADRGDGTSAYSDAVAVSLVPVSPGIYAFSGKEPRAGLLLHGAIEQAEPLTADSPAKPGEVLTVWAAGLGAVEGTFGNKNAGVQTPVSAMIDGQPALVLSATLPEEAVGVYEVRVQMPVGIAPNKAASLVLSQNGVKSNAVVFPVALNN